MILIERPYVFLFLIAFLVISWRHQGGARTLVWLASGYVIALASEALSIRTGFPYGQYFYIYENLTHDLLVAGVPFWDSLSYPFLCYASYCVATRAMIPAHLLRLILLSALFTTILDSVIDPIAHRGDRWFLGKIYYYPEPGFYFDVPVTNFLGWFFVSSLIVGANRIIDRLLPSLPDEVRRSPNMGIYFYASIFLFNFAITLFLREFLLALFDILWITLPFFLLYRAKKHLKSPYDPIN